MRKYSLVLLKEEIIMLETAMMMEKKMDEMMRLLTARIRACLKNILSCSF